MFRPVGKLSISDITEKQIHNRSDYNVNETMNNPHKSDFKTMFMVNIVHGNITATEHNKSN